MSCLETEIERILSSFGVDLIPAHSGRLTPFRPHSGTMDNIG
jgi:hypothetical protein